MAVDQLDDLSGGYVTNKPIEQLRSNELLKAEDCYWDSKLKKRRGLKQYATLSAGGTNRGGIRAYVNSTWYTFVAEDSGGVVRFYSATTTNFTQIDASFTWTTAKEVEFEALNGNVVGVSADGSDWPLLIDWDGSVLRIRNLEAADVRERGNSTWIAGQWDDSEPAGSEYVADTPDAQDAAGADDFLIAMNATNDDGFVVAADHTFNKIVLGSAQQMTGSPVAAYYFWNPTTKAKEAFTPTTVPTYTDAEADRTIEWDWELVVDSGFYNDESATAETQFKKRYPIWVQFSTAPSNTVGCDTVAISHTQYLRQILEATKPHLVRQHGNRIFLAVGIYTLIGRINGVTNWHVDDTEYFQEGGAKITAMVSFGAHLAVFKERAIFHLTGNSYKNWGKDKLWEGMGTIESRAAISTKGVVCFVETKGGIGMWDGRRAAIVSGHIQNDIDTLTSTGAAAVEYGALGSRDKHYWVCFPTSDVLLRMDPDTTQRDDDTGDFFAAFYKYTAYRVDLMMNHDGSGDNGLLLGLDNGSTKQVVQLERTDASGTDFTSTAITITARPVLRHRRRNVVDSRTQMVKRIAVRLSKSGDWAMTAHADEGDASAPSVTIASGSGATPFQSNHVLPYTMDRHNVALEISNAELQEAEIHSIGYEHEAKAF